MSLTLPRPLFFYGVLMPGLVSGRMGELVALLGEPRSATTEGRLYAVPDPRGHYPVMVATEGNERVSGAVLIPGPQFGPAELAELDAFEGFEPGKPAGSDYVRRELAAWLPGGRTRAADAYWWNRPIGGDFIPIAHGNFARYLAESGARHLPG